MTTDFDQNQAALREQAKQGRRAFALTPLSRFVQKMQEVMRDYLKARESGVSREDAVLGIEEVLRAEWPRKPSKFKTCDGCDDTGWHLMFCTHEMRCQRPVCQEKHPAWEHTYVVPCDCAKGDPFRRSGLRPERSLDDELSGVGKTKKRGGFTRFGGR